MSVLRNRTADIIIVGGGIMGLCLAYFLAKKGTLRIILFEKGLLAQASTGLCAGGIRLQFSHPANIRLSKISLRIFERIKDELGSGVEIFFRQAGYLFLTSDGQTWKDFQSARLLQNRMGVPSESLLPDEIRSRWPYINTTDLLGGTFCGRDGYADPYLTAMAFAGKAKNLGVKIHEETPVRDILIRGGKIHGVRTDTEIFSAPVVVNAAGPWAAEVGHMAGVPLPVQPVRRQVFMATSPEALPKPVPMVIDMDTLFYFRGENPGLLMGMSDPDEPTGFNTSVDRDFLEKVVGRALHRAPVLADARIIRGWGGLYAVTPDENPIIGKISDPEGFFCAVGFSGHGFQHGPAVGRILSEILLQNGSDFDLSPFRHDRFDGRTQGEKRVV